MAYWRETWAFWLKVHCAFYFLPFSMLRGSSGNQFCILNIVSVPVAVNNYVFSNKRQLNCSQAYQKEKVTVRSKRIIETYISETFGTRAFSSLYWMPSICQTLWPDEWFRPYPQLSRSGGGGTDMWMSNCNRIWFVLTLRLEDTMRAWTWSRGPCLLN